VLCTVVDKGRTIQPKLDRTDPVKSAVSESAVQYRSNTDSDLQWTVRKCPLATESVKRCTNGMVYATPLSAADIGCFRLSINNVRLQPARFIGHRTTWQLPTGCRHCRCSRCSNMCHGCSLNYRLWDHPRSGGRWRVLIEAGARWHADARPFDAPSPR